MDKKIYYFDKPLDMVLLAKFVEGRVYWGYSFYDGEDAESESLKYSSFWEFIEEPVMRGAKSVTIIDNEYVTINY